MGASGYAYAYLSLFSDCFAASEKLSRILGVVATTLTTEKKSGDHERRLLQGLLHNNPLVLFSRWR